MGIPPTLGLYQLTAGQVYFKIQDELFQIDERIAFILNNCFFKTVMFHDFVDKAY